MSALATPRPQAPRPPSRTRLLRPAIFTDDVTGTLDPAAFVAYVGLATRSDDGGYLLWNPAALAAALMPYADPGRRARDLERIGGELVALGLLEIFDCGCAELIRLVRDFAISAGNKTYAIREWHESHISPDESGSIGINPSESVSSSVDGSLSESLKGSPTGPGSGDGSASASESGLGRARELSDGEWLDQLHRAGMPINRDADQAWLAWLAPLKRRHADQAILDAVLLVVGRGEIRPGVVRDLVNVALVGGAPRSSKQSMGSKP